MRKNEMEPGPLLRYDISSDFGVIRIFWVDSARGPQVNRILLPGDRDPEDGHSAHDNPRSSSIHTLVSGIQDFLRGSDVCFDTRILDFSQCTPFQRSVLLAESGIPRGYVNTYGRIAWYIGVPAGARAVGNALAHNPFPIVIPCHRALRQDGDPGGFQGGREMKRGLLRLEGVRFRKDNRVIMEHVWY